MEPTAILSRLAETVRLHLPGVQSIEREPYRLDFLVGDHVILTASILSASGKIFISLEDFTDEGRCYRVSLSRGVAVAIRSLERRCLQTVRSRWLAF